MSEVSKQDRWADIEAAIAEIVAEHLLYDVGEEFTFEDVERVNNVEGWTVELSAPMGNTLHIDGIHLSPTALRRVWEEARRMATEAYEEAVQ